MQNNDHDENNKDPKYHTAKVKQELFDLVTHLRKDVGVVDDPKFKALFETAAEVLLGLKKAIDDYEKGEESAWK